MSYRIYAFDGLELPRLRTLDQEHDMGTGRALTSFQQLPGGFFDHYGDNRSPQGIRPITLQGWIVEDTTVALRTALDALRGKLGVRGKLTAAFEDGQLRWQWARLVAVETPSKVAHLRSSPVELTFQTADQVWFGVVTSPAEWTWGDLAWTFGDGTAEMGEAGTEATISVSAGGLESFTVTNVGSLAARSLAVVITPGTSSITSLRYQNYTSGDMFYISQTIGVGESLIIDGGARSVWLRSALLNIEQSIPFNGTTATILTTTVHGLTTGDTVLIADTGLLDGIHRNIVVLSTSQFTITTDVVGSIVLEGTVRKLTSRYDNFKSNDSRFPTLAVGENLIWLTVGGNAGQDATIGWEYNNEYA